MIYLFTILSCTGSVRSLIEEGDNCLTSTEENLLKEHIKDIRKGIRLFDNNPDESLGICKPGAKHPQRGYISCEKFISKDAPDLPEGKYILYAHFSAPVISQDNKGWKIDFTRECKTTKSTGNGESITTDSYSQTYYVKNYNGKGNHLSPLATITSPGIYGAKECNWTLTLFNVNEEKEIKGFWSVPAK